MEKYGICPNCKRDSVHLATAFVHEFYGDQDDGEGNESEYADQLAPQGEVPEVSLFAHICFGCGHLVDVGIEQPRDKAINTSERTEEAIVTHRAHWGDPCVYCGVPHDEVKVGPCPGH